MTDDRDNQRPDEDSFLVDTRRGARHNRPAPEPTRPVTQSPTRQMPTASSGHTAYGEQPPAHHEQQGQSGGYAPPAPAPAQIPPRKRVSARTRRRRLFGTVLLLVIGWLGFMIWVPFSAWGEIRRVNAIPSGDRPAAGEGRNYLLVGSDSREGLSTEEQDRLSTGSDAGKRTDSIMLVHVSNAGKTSALISIPRDSYVAIPGKGKNKINAAYAFGGPTLLIHTVEQATGVRVDGYLEIGFGGFSSVVDSLNGVDIDVPFDMNDDKAGINLKKGLQTLDGPNALGFVRSRYSDPRGDLGRADRQREFLSAVMKKSLSPSTFLVPTRYYGFSRALASGLTMSEGLSMNEAKDIFMAMKSISGGNGISALVPISNAGYNAGGAGLAVKWDDAKAKALFDAVRTDRLTAGSGS